MPPLVEPQKEKDDTRKVAQANVQNNTKGRARFFCVKAVEELPLAIFHVKLDRTFGNGSQSGSVGRAGACGRDVRGGGPSRPTHV